jgi:hypothetical protein
MLKQFGLGVEDASTLNWEELCNTLQVIPYLLTERRGKPWWVCIQNKGT